jgi:alanine racemase
LRDLSPGDSVGYNATFTTDRAMRAATVSLGYADGFLRCWAGHGALRFGEALLPLLGRVSMDMVVVDASAVPELREGDWLEVPYHLPQAADRCGLSQYELLTTLGRRFQRQP